MAILSPSEAAGHDLAGLFQDPAATATTMCVVAYMTSQELDWGCEVTWRELHDWVANVKLSDHCTRALGAARGHLGYVLLSGLGVLGKSGLIGYPGRLGPRFTVWPQLAEHLCQRLGSKPPAN